MQKSLCNVYLCVILHFYAEYHEYMHNFFRTSAPIDLTYSAPPLSHRYKNTIMFDPFITHNFGRDDNLSFLRLSPASDAEIKACASENSPAAKDKKNSPHPRGANLSSMPSFFDSLRQPAVVSVITASASGKPFPASSNCLPTYSLSSSAVMDTRGTQASILPFLPSIKPVNI